MKEILLERKNLNNPQIREYTEAIKRGSKSQHVSPSKNGSWIVTSDDKKVPKSFDNKEEAINYARVMAKSRSSAVFTHSTSGRIIDREDY